MGWRSKLQIQKALQDSSRGIRVLSSQMISHFLKLKIIYILFNHKCLSCIRIRIRMSFIGQVCLHIRGICYSDRSSTVQQNDSNRTQTTKEQYTNRQCTKWQKHNIQYRQLCVRSDMCTFLNKRRPDGNSSKRESAGCEGSRVILPVLLLTLDRYSSWRVRRVVPMIRSAVRTTLRSLLRSDLVDELNQTVIDMQRTDSMMAE